MTASLPPPWLLALQRRLLEVGDDFAGLAQGDFQALDPSVLAERYRRLFMPRVAGANPGAVTSNSPRWQRANQTLADFASRIAVDAFARFDAALASTDAGEPPIASMRALHALWIDCGEAAYAAVAGTDEYATAQAELLSAMLE